MSSTVFGSGQFARILALSSGIRNFPSAPRVTPRILIHGGAISTLEHLIVKIRINTWHLITFDCLLLHLQCLLYAAELMQGSKTKLYLFQLQTFAICTFCVIGNCWKLRGLSAILIQKAFWSKESHSVAWEAGFLNNKCMILEINGAIFLPLLR